MGASCEHQLYKAKKAETVAIEKRLFICNSFTGYECVTKVWSILLQFEV